jgi:hypothetical protein
MTFRIAEFCLGIALAAVTLRDVFDTVVVPGASDASLRIARRLVRLLLPLWKLMRRSGRGLSTTFAPVILVSSFVSWMLFLDIAFGLMAHALGAWFDPPLTSFPQAMFVVGSGLVTVGTAATEASGGARGIILAAGFCGLAVMTMAVTYLLEVQSSIAHRDSGILKLKTSAGEPPSALGLLEKYAAIGNQAELPHVLRDGRDWCATVRQSHGAHPSLIYFRSAGTGAGWPAALAALLDLALIVELMLDAPDLRGLAVLLREDGTQMAEELGSLVGLVPRPDGQRDRELDEIRSRLLAARYRLNDSPDLAMFGRLRNAYAGWVNAMGDHLGRPSAPLISGRG